MLFSLAIIYIIGLGSYRNQQNPIADNGCLDLSQINLDENMVGLNGQWEFYPMEFKNSEFIPEDYISVPGSWNNKIYDNQKITGDFYATCRLKIKLPEKGLYCFKTRNIANAYKLIVNGQTIGTKGQISTDSKNEKATWEDKMIPFYNDSDEIDVIMQISSHQHTYIGIIDSIAFGSYNSVSENSLKNIIKSALIMGIFAGFGFYLILLYRPGHNKHMYMYLGVFCICSFILDSIVDAGLIYYFFRSIPFWFISKLQYIVYVGVFISMQLFIRSMYKKEASYKFCYIVNVVNIIYVISILALPMEIYSCTTLIYITVFTSNVLCGIITLIRAIINKRRFAPLLFIGMCALCTSAAIDILYVNSSVDTYFRYSSHIMGILFFLVCEVYVLSVDVDDAFKSSTKAKDMEIAFLQAQIAPHFFFNTLNNIYYLMDESVIKAKGLIIDFCNFLRVKHKFDYRKNPVYSLEEEIDLIDSFVKIENVRFDNMINLIIDISDDIKNVLIPQLLIQPIVENAIKHGFSGKKLDICIKAFRKDDMVEISVTNNGNVISKDIISKLLDDSSVVGGVGLRNINYRLDKCYNTKMVITSDEIKGTSISFDILMEVEDGSSTSR